MIVTLDALGTLYRFKEPFPVQYRRMAKTCGLKASYNDTELEKSFRRAFKSLNVDFPNYGKDRLANPQVWWDMLVKETFAPIIGDENLPLELGHRLYNHFSSGSAYELFPDVRPFLDVLDNLRKNEPEGPLLILGVISNSDPRVRQVLNSFGLRVGPSSHPLNSVAEIGEWARNSTLAGDTSLTPFLNYYNSDDDFNFLATSYEAGFEKPDRRIFEYARKLALPIPISLFEQRHGGRTTLFKDMRNMHQAFWLSANQITSATWIHIGDDFNKDYLAAKGSGFGIDSLLLARDGKRPETEEGETEIVESLEEAAAIINLMARNLLKIKS